MSTRSLPLRPSLTQLKLQAKELQRAHAERKPSAAARIAAHHPRMTGQPLEHIMERSLSVADAQLVLAREYGFQGWAHLKRQVEMGNTVSKFKPHARFDDALAALDVGAIHLLRDLLGAQPDLIHARTNLEPPYGYFTGATLLHHIAWNPGREAPVPKNIVAVASMLLDVGADVNALTLGPSGGTTMGLVISSKQASDAGVSGPLMDLLLEYGATLESGASSVVPDWAGQDVLDLSLANHAPRAAEKLIELGATVDVCAAAALGRMDLVRECFDERGHLRTRPRRNGKVLTERDAIGLALLFAYVNQHSDAVEYLLEKDGNWDMTGVNNGTAMHRAAWAGDLPLVQQLVSKGADITNRDNPFHSTPLSWAQHNRQGEVFEWMRAHCAIDLHDAVCFDLREHVVARLNDDPASVNRLIDQWEIPRCAPLHWAAWLHYDDAGGKHSHDLATRKQLVKLLLDNGADPNIVAGNGLTALDIARAGNAPAISALLEHHGGRRASDL